MKRVERIYEYVQEHSAHLHEDDLFIGGGVTTGEIAEFLALKRPNVSKDLNELVREGRLLKLDGRPVRYVDRSVQEYKPLQKKVSSYKESPVTTQESTEPSKKIVGQDIFSKVIGSSGSMKTQVEQAKASILYPPKGLNCLITGQTGTGKTYFAHAMFRFAKTSQVIAAEKELVVFNCADYAHNPELLMSYLFGYKKGAFTGANETTDGLVQQANGGMLFLDEVHRLPPEGQEMIFYLMDHGTYNRLGETQKQNAADVRIVCATTEDPTSALLATFVRRIPIVIQLPKFENRPEKEKMELLKNMVSLEADRIQKRITLNEDAVKALIGSVTYGNVGQLKSNVQLVCARGFLNHMEQDEIKITLEELTPAIREGILQLASNRQALANLTQYLEPTLTISPGTEPVQPISGDAYELPYNLYEIIGDKAALLKEEGVDQEHINNFITTDINVHLKSFYKDSGFTFDVENKLAEIVDKKIIEITKKIYEYAIGELGHTFQANFIYAMSLHISSFLKRIQLGQHNRVINSSIKNMVNAYPAEFKVAQHIKKMIQKAYDLQIPEGETYYLTVLLASLSEEKNVGRIGIVVATHGKNTATSMVQVVTTLLNVHNIRAVDMPLEMKPRVALTNIVDAVKEVDEGSGVILLVDMGSLGTFSDEIIEKTAIQVKTIDMVTTAVVLEAARKTSLIDTDLTELHHSLKHFRGYAETIKEKQPVSKAQQLLPQAIVAICASGEGTARQIKVMIEDTLVDYFEQEIVVLTISVVSMEETLKDIQEKYQVLAIAGVTNPKIGVPFISLETFFSGNGQKTLKKILQENQAKEQVELDEESAKEICVQYMKDSFLFINPDKAVGPLWEFVTLLDEENTRNYSMYINILMHTAGALERILKQDPLVVDEDLGQLQEDVHYQRVMKAIKFLEESFHMAFPQEEVYYIIQLLHTQVA